MLQCLPDDLVLLYTLSNAVCSSSPRTGTDGRSPPRREEEQAPPQEPFASLHRSRAVNALVVSPDTEWVASGSEDGTIILMSAINPANHLHWRTGSAVHALVYSPDSKWLASAHESGYIYIWSIQCDGPPESSTFNVTLSSPSRCSDTFKCIRALAWSPNGRYIAAGSDDASVYISHGPTSSGKPAFRGISKHSLHTVTFVAFSLDSRLLAYGMEDNRCYIWNVEENKQQAKYKAKKQTQGPIRHCEFSKQGDKIVICFGDGTARMWSISDFGNTPLWISSSSRFSMQAVSFLPNGRFALIGEAEFGGRTHLLAGQDSVPQHHTLQLLWCGGIGGHTAVHFSPHAKFIAIASPDGMVRLWDPCALTVAPLHIFKHKFNQTGSVVTQVTFSCNGSILVSAANDGTVCHYAGVTPQ